MPPMLSRSISMLGITPRVLLNHFHSAHTQNYMATQNEEGISVTSDKSQWLLVRILPNTCSTRPTVKQWNKVIKYLPLTTTVSTSNPTLLMWLFLPLCETHVYHTVRQLRNGRTHFNSVIQRKLDICKHSGTSVLLCFLFQLAIPNNSGKDQCQMSPAPLHVNTSSQALH